MYIVSLVFYEHSSLENKILNDLVIVENADSEQAALGAALIESRKRHKEPLVIHHVIKVPTNKDEPNTD